MAVARLPEWLQRSPGLGKETVAVKRLLRAGGLNTVCEEARCPNISECFGRNTATFLILGEICTRGCRFCSVQTGRPSLSADSFNEEAVRLADAAAELKLKHVVVTSVTRDDLEDGGAAGFVAAIKALKDRIPESTVEVLIPDFAGNRAALEQVIEAAPHVLNHNVETVPRLYKFVRPQAVYARSLSLLKTAKEIAPDILTKTGVMVGLGETTDEVVDVMRDAKEVGVDVLTIGQYMQPTRSNLPVDRYLTPEEFAQLQNQAKQFSFRHAAIGPLVRSSYNAQMYQAAQ